VSADELDNEILRALGFSGRPGGLTAGVTEVPPGYVGRVKAVRDLMRRAWDEGYRRRDPNDAAPLAGDNPYEEES
jgi:hypothetical protein